MIPRHDDDTRVRNEVEPAARPVDELLQAAGRAHRESGAFPALTERSMERIQRAVEAVADGESVKPPRAAGVVSWRVIAQRWIQPALVGAAAAVAVLVAEASLRSDRGPVATVLYSTSGSAEEGAPVRAVSLERGQSILATEEPGTLVQVGDQLEVFLRPNTSVEVVSDRVLALQTGGIWVYHTGEPGSVQILTPQGSVAPAGTVFGVELESDLGGALQVSVMSGSVEVHRSRQASPVVVAAGQELRWAPAAQTPQVEAASVTVPGWTREVIAAYRGEFFRRYFTQVASRS